jgi:hypothetical protein
LLGARERLTEAHLMGRRSVVGLGG